MRLLRIFATHPGRSSIFLERSGIFLAKPVLLCGNRGARTDVELEARTASEPDYALDGTGEDAATRAAHFPPASEAPNDEQ